jgi:hypothetical protein
VETNQRRGFKMRNSTRIALVGATIVSVPLMGTAIASAYPIQDQCRVATIPTSLCDGKGGVVSGGGTSGETHETGIPSRVWQEDKTYITFDYDEETEEWVVNLHSVPDVAPGNYDNDGFYVRDYDGNFEKNK